MNIDWGALGSVLGVSVISTVGLVGLFTLGIAALSRQEAAEARGAAAPLARGGAYACFALCAAAVAYGIYLIAL
ncbi:hypothetical protein NGB36_23050 [Streptomyces sp. RB6PN25]|uniref:Secreted protein n=1 Tax=Streptomyces humicola TaxID=2953240 RepID=A0ABT1Q0E2_9ACTN|nr:hypothetical protein [Streptomyces humicola]MCQ4083402.1 hypothetical protein [Streptomyces humicola]